MLASQMRKVYMGFRKEKAVCYNQKGKRCMLALDGSLGCGSLRNKTATCQHQGWEYFMLSSERRRMQAWFKQEMGLYWLHKGEGFMLGSEKNKSVYWLHNDGCTLDLHRRRVYASFQQGWLYVAFRQAKGVWWLQAGSWFMVVSEIMCDSLIYEKDVYWLLL